MAILDFPAAVNRFFSSMISGLYRSATNAGIKKAFLSEERPIFDIVARGRNEVPDWRICGATPIKAANALAFLNSR